MELTIKIQLIINGKFYATGHWRKKIHKMYDLNNSTPVHRNRELVRGIHDLATSNYLCM